jgi:hypothetical protein
MIEQPTVVFVDILGFSDLVMATPEHGDALDGFFYANMSKGQLRESLMGDRPEDPLTRIFAAFHRMLDIRVTELMNADPLQTIVFSDSAFVVFKDLNCALYFAQAFMRDLISFCVPARMGIGQGTFRGLRLTTDISDQVRRHSSQFLGTGVIRAHRAESCGLKGLRILIHPDSKIVEDWPGDLCTVAEGEDDQKFAPSVIQELNYLPHYPDFDPKLGGPQTTEEAYNEMTAKVTEMMNAAPEKAKKQYQRTLIALARMRVAYASTEIRLST